MSIKVETVVGVREAINPATKESGEKLERFLQENGITRSQIISVSTSSELWPERIAHMITLVYEQ